MADRLKQRVALMFGAGCCAPGIGNGRATALAYAREDHERLVARLALERDPQAVAADLVLCQTGCLGHGNFWRVQDQCRRSGKACVLIEGAGRLEHAPEPIDTGGAT